MRLHRAHSCASVRVYPKQLPGPEWHRGFFFYIIPVKALEVEMNSIALAIVAGAAILAYVLGHQLRQINQTVAILVAILTDFVKENENDFVESDEKNEEPQLNFIDCLRCIVDHLREIRNSLKIK